MKISSKTFFIIMVLNLSAFGQGLGIFDQMQDVIISVSETVKPTVVHIEVVKKHNDQRFQGLGSGLIIREDGYILTNEHVVDRQIKITVTLESKLEYPAEVIGVDKLTDLALIKITIPPEVKLKAAKLGNSDSVKVGQWVIAVGNPYGFDRTVSFGIISGKGRVLNMPDNAPLLNDFIQTDAAIDPGSSGGPLINLHQEVVGINSIGVGRMQGFTIPINVAIDVMAKLMATGTIERGYVGLVTQPFNRSFAKFYGKPSLEGLMVSDVYADQPAARAGIKPGDIIVEFDGKPVAAETEDDMNKFSVDVSQVGIGQKKQIKLIRDGKPMTVTVTIGQKPKVKADEYETEFDFTVEEITDEMYRDYLLETKEGVYVRFVEVGSPADKGGLESGDIITKVDDEAITNLADFKKTMKSINKPDYLLLRILRGKNFAFALLDFTDKEKPSAEDKNQSDED
jgi:serine protease Do